jgi:hypothetical protein
LNALEIIWLGSLILAGTTLIVMAALVVARLFSQRWARRRAQRRRELVRSLLTGDGIGAEQLRKVPADLLAGTYLDLIRLVRCEERDAFVAEAERLGVAERLGRQLRRGSARERLEAARSLGQFRASESIGPLHRALADRNDEVRLAAALSLAEHDDQAALRDLVEELGLGTSEDSLLIISLFRTLAERRPEDVKALVRAPDLNAQVRLAAIEALAGTGDYGLVPLIAELALAAPDGSEELPRYLRALGSLGHPAGRTAVLDGMGRSAPYARAAAAAAAGRIGLVDAADRLVALLGDPEWWVRYQAGEALVRLGPDGLRALRIAAREGSEQVRDAAATILAEHAGLP